MLGSQAGPGPQRLPHHRADPSHPSLVLFGAPLLSLLQHCGSSWAQKFLRKHHLPLASAFPLKHSREHSSGTEVRRPDLRAQGYTEECRWFRGLPSAVPGWACFSGLGQWSVFVCYRNKTQGSGSRPTGRYGASWQMGPGVLGVSLPPPPPARTWSPCPPGRGAGPLQGGMFHLGKSSSHSRAPLWRWGVGAERGGGVSG